MRREGVLGVGVRGGVVVLDRAGAALARAALPPLHPDAGVGVPGTLG